MKSLKPLLLSSLVAGSMATAAWSGQMATQNQDYVITKDLWGATGNSSLASSDGAYTLGFAWGEPASGDVISEPSYTIISGYYGGRFGSSQSIRVLSSQIGTPGAKTFFQDHVQVGVPFDTSIQITFSDELEESTIRYGVQVYMATDHMGHTSNTPAAVSISTDTLNHQITIRPEGAWLGNTLYDIQLTPDLLSTDGFQLDQLYHIDFVTILDHHQENVVLNPIIPVGGSAGTGNSSVGPLSIDIPTESLSEYSAVLLSRDPITSPLHVDPKIIQEANEKARAAGGSYRIPISIQEVSAFNANGDLLGPLSKPAEISIDYGTGFGAPSASAGLIRPQTLSIWVLDQTHRLWVKIPASQNVAGFHTVAAPVTQLSVFALMGSPDGSASDAFAFPVPWRPHGPNAGTNSGQSGSEADGITFSNLPSECSIKIYTIAGDLVRHIQHSDTGGLIGQEKWDVKTTHGDTVASGVYLWRVESSVDGKNGKLMVIR